MQLLRAIKIAFNCMSNFRCPIPIYVCKYVRAFKNSKVYISIVHNRVKILYTNKLIAQLSCLRFYKNVCSPDFITFSIRCIRFWTQTLQYVGYSVFSSIPLVHTIFSDENRDPRAAIRTCIFSLNFGKLLLSSWRPDFFFQI